MPPLRLTRARAAGLAVAAASGAAALSPAVAHAVPTVVPLEPCYVSVGVAQRQNMGIAATGFAANAAVAISIDDQDPVTVDAGADGSVNAHFAAPYQKRGERTVTITLTDQANPLDTVTTTTKVTALSVTVRPRQAATSHRVRFRGRGFTSQKAIWAHYVFRNRDRKTVRFAKQPKGDCGRFSRHAKQIPITRPRAGKWTVQIDQQKHWSPQPDSVFYPVPITVERVIGH